VITNLIVAVRTCNGSVSFTCLSLCHLRFESQEAYAADCERRRPANCSTGAADANRLREDSGRVPNGQSVNRIGAYFNVARIGHQKIGVI
jgi:hypothetical protein